MTAVRGAISFRARLLLALTGSVALLALAGFAAVYVQTNRQIDQTIARTADRGQKILAELERFRRADLERVAARIAGSIRVVAAFDAAIDDRDAEAFIENLRYELTLAEFGRGLVAFTDKVGHPFATLVDGQVIGQADSAARASTDGPSGPMVEGDAGYRAVNNVLYSVHAHPLALFGETIGTMLIGFPVDQDVATRFGEMAGADVCFAADDRCLVATPAVQSRGLTARMVAATHSERAVVTDDTGRRLALVSTRLAAASPTFAVLAVPLDDVLQPFANIQFVENLAAGGALIIALGLGILLSRRLTTPIRILVAATERVRRGDYDFSVTTPHADEFGTLAGAFNQMTQGLLLKERYRSVLDKVVSPKVADELMKGDVRLGGENRELSVLFADVRGFTSLTETMDPKDVLAMLNEWLDLAAAVVEEEGGVVDKYVGDEVMALFGAPVAQADHALRAVRAGLRLRDLTLEMNVRRGEQGRPPLSVGIGINTGVAVAGNMGSANRLNYSVLGVVVNTGARLCSQAGGDEVLVGDATYQAVAPYVDSTRLEARTLKGLSAAVSPHLIHGLKDLAPPPSSRSVATGLLVLLPALMLGGAATVSAQTLDVPTLSEMGIEYRSPGGLVQVKPSLSLTVDVLAPQADGAGLVTESSAFVAGHVRLFGDVFIGRRLFASAELRIDRGQPPGDGSLQARMQQAFVRWTPVPGRRFHVEAGKFISPFGTYARRAHTTSDAFVRPPLFHDHRTVMQADAVPVTGDGVLTWKDTPRFRAAGLPVVWDVPYPIGASIDVGARGFSGTAAIVTSSPSADPQDWNRLSMTGASGPTFTGRASYQLGPEVVVGGSYSRGSYLRPVVTDTNGPVVTGRQTQMARGADITIRRGYTDIRAELVVNRWDVFRVAGSPRDVSYYVEARRTIAPGLYAAARYGAMHFRDVQATSGRADRWDYDVRRWQFAAGYRLGRNSEVKAEYMWNRTKGTADARDNMLSLQWWLSL